MESRSTANYRSGMSSTRFLLGAVLWSAVAISVIYIWQRRSPPDAAQAGPTEQNEGNSAGQTSDPSDDGRSDPSPSGGGGSAVNVRFPPRKLPDFEFDEVMGGKFGLSDLKGKRWVASMVFSRCTQTCPTISAAMMRLHERVEKSAPDVVFVTFTVDAKFDKLDVFRQYSEIWTRGNHERWKFLTGDDTKITDLIVNGFGLYVKENPPETRLPGIEVAHSNRVVLVNEDGIPVATFLGTKESDMVRLRLILTGRSEFPEPSSGLTFSTPGGSIQPIELQAVPSDADKNESEDSDNADSTSPADTPAADPPQKTGANATDDSAGASTSDASTSDASTSDASTSDADKFAQSSEQAVTPTDHNARIDSALPGWARSLPAWNAGLNSLAAVFLVAGFIAIRQQKRTLHRNLMIAAFATSVVFLACYLTYHYALGKYTGEHGKRFTGDGIAAAAYQLILWPHIVLAAAVPVLAVLVFRHAFAERWDAHKSLARITLPIWMFVSVTGVIIYGMLYHWPWPAAQE